MGDLAAKIADFVWDVVQIKEGNNVETIIEGMKLAKSKTGKGKPVSEILHKIMVNGVDFMMHTYVWHGKAPNDKQLVRALEQNPETLGVF